MLSILGKQAIAARDEARYSAGYAAGMMSKVAGDAKSVYALSGRLVLSSSNWGLLEIPNAMVRGLFAALDVPGAELPLRDGKLNAHVSVFRGSEIEALGGGARVSEWGKRFKFQIGPIQEVEPKGWDDVSKCWMVRVESPELKQLRKSYGLTPLPNADHEFHATIAVRKKNVLQPGPVSKAAASYFHGSPHKFDKLDAGSWVTPYREDARSFGVPWSTDELEDAGGEDGRPPSQLRFKPGRGPDDGPLHVYAVDGPVAPAKTNTGVDYAWNRQLTAETPAKLIEAHPSWRAVHGSAAIKAAADPASPPMPYARDAGHLMPTYGAFGQRPAAGKSLVDGLHGAASPRAPLVAAARAGGYPSDPAVVPASTAALLSRTQPHQQPPTLPSDPGRGSAFDDRTGTVRLAPRPGPEDAISLNRAATMRHETEHALTVPPKDFDLPKAPGMTRSQSAMGPLRHAAEYSATLGDLPFTAQAYKEETGRPLNVPVEVAPGVGHDADWMARQAERHGFFGGRSMTDLLATPSGQSYTKRLLDAQPVRGGREKSSTLFASAAISDGGVHPEAAGVDDHDAPARTPAPGHDGRRQEGDGLPGPGLRAGVRHPLPGGPLGKSAALVAAELEAPAGRQRLAGADAGEGQALIAKAASDPEIVIDRPKGHQKTFRLPSGPLTVTYPVDYGYLKGLKNPQDGEDADVFVGSGGPHFGRYMKGNTTGPAWKPDEHKWYTGLTDDEHAGMMKFWHDQDPKLLRDHVRFGSHADLLKDVRGRAAIKAAGSYADPDHPGGITPGPIDPYEDSSKVDEHGKPCPPGECCPHCCARLERGDDGDCNRCGEMWPNGHSKLADAGIKAAAGWHSAVGGLLKRQLTGTLGRTALGGVGGAAVGLGELQSGMADPNMSGEGKGALIGINALAGAGLANPGVRRALFTHPTYKAVPNSGAIPQYVRQSVVSPGRVLGATAAVAGLPKYMNLTDTTARWGRVAQDAYLNKPEVLRAVTDPSQFIQDTAVAQAGKATTEALASPAAQEGGRAFGRSLGYGVAGLAGGGLAGHFGGQALGNLIAPDDENLDYKTRRFRDRSRAALDLGGSTLGSLAGMYALQNWMPKAAANCLMATAADG